jgi:hypothetical protein
MNKIQIEPQSNLGHAPYEHLIPIVDALLQAGNLVVGSSKFYRDTDGWRCDLKYPIDFEIIRRKFDLPSSILLSDNNDAILCQQTWIEIKGKGSEQ